MTLVLLILHGLASVLLLGALSHQLLSVWDVQRRQAPSFMERVRAVHGPSYTNAVIVLYVTTWLLGILIYPAYTLGIRQDFKMNVPVAFGVFEIKEHLAAIGLGVLPAYACSWRARETPAPTRTTLVTLLAVIVWFDFVVGHVLNNLGGL